MCSTCSEAICADGTCLRRQQLCDGKKDCSDGSDEEGCDQLSFRFVDGNEVNGNVQVSFKGMWQSVCAQNVGEDSANTICHKMNMGTPANVLTASVLNSFGWQINCDGRCSLRGYTFCQYGARIRCHSAKPARYARVVGGFETTAGAFPWTAAVRNKATGAHHCGASVLDRTHLITAAHCFEEDRRPTSYIVVVGDWDNTVNEGHEQIFDVSRFYFYPLYEDLFAHDLAIIEISGRGMRFDDWTQPICLPPRDFVYQAGRKCVVSGWGSMGLTYPSRLQAAVLPIIDRAECMNSSRIYSSMSRSAFCAGYLHGGVDSCQGDSGGPLACQNGNGPYVLAGVISWGDGCAQKGQPGIYTMIRAGARKCGGRAATDEKKQAKKKAQLSAVNLHILVIKMDKLQGGDWSSFFHQFEAVASQSPANVSRPSIVDDNVPLPIVRGHHFDIAYQETVDEHVKCQVCGMLLRRTMFAAHVRQRHPELCPPSLSTDDDSGRHSGLESPDISRNPNFPFSPKLMSPPIAKEPIKLTISLKGHRKHRRRKTKRERRGEDGPTTPFEEEHQSPLSHTSNNDDNFFWPSDDQPGPSTQTNAPLSFGLELSPSGRFNVPESSQNTDSTITRISPIVQARAELEDSSDEDSRRRKRRKSRRKVKRKEHDVAIPSPPLRSRVLPAVEPLRLAITPDGARVIDSSSRTHHSPQGTCRIASQTERARPETRSYTHSQQTSTRSAFTDLIQSFPATSHVLPVAQPFPHFTSQPTTSKGSASEAQAQVITVGQPAKRAERTDVIIDTMLPQIPPVATVLTPSSWVYSQSQITTDTTLLPAYNTRSGGKSAVESASFRAEAIPFDPVIKPTAILEPEPVKLASENTVAEEDLVDPLLTENRRPVLPQRKTRQPSGSQEAWEPLGIKSPTYGIVLPVAPRQDNDADDATVAFLTSSPELLSEDDSCAVKEEIEEVQSTQDVPPSRAVRQKFRSAPSATSESTDTDQRTIIDVEEDQAERRSSDRDGEVQSLTIKLAALSQDLVASREQSVDQQSLAITKSPSEGDERSDRETTRATPAESDKATQPVEKKLELSDQRSSREDLVFTPETQYIPVLDSAQEDRIASERLAEYKRPDMAGEVLAHSAVDQASLDRVFEEAIQEEFVSSQQLAAGVSALSIESESGEMPIHVLVSSRFNESVQERDVAAWPNEYGQEDIEACVCPVDHVSKLMKYREEEELSSYEEDYSAEDDELVDLHESSVSNCHELEQQSQYEQILRQQAPSSGISTEELICPETPTEEQMLHQEMTLPQVCVPQQWPSQYTWRSHSGPRELSVQTTFENLSQVVVHHSEPIPHKATSHRPSVPISFNSANIPQQLLQSPPPHSFPLQCGSQKVLSSQWQMPRYSTQISAQQPTVQVVEQSTDLNQRQLLYKEELQLIHYQYQHSQFQPYKPQQPVVSALSKSHRQPQILPPISFEQDYERAELQNEQISQQQQQANFITRGRQPSELLEEEMRAMRYVYLMNEQRHAKKSLAEVDKKIARKLDQLDNLIFLPELPPIIIEPTVIPEGVPRHRMQEHILPPYYHAQFAVRDGPCVSPHKSESENECSDDDIRKLQDILDFSLLEPPLLHPTVQSSAQHSPHKAQHGQSQTVVDEPQHQQYHCSESYRSPQFPLAEHPQEISSQQLLLAPEPSAARPQQPLEIAFSNIADATMISRKSASGSEEESEISTEESSVNNEEESQKGSDDSTDSETVRKLWDLSPSVSPLTLEALASGLSSPEGSDSNDGQTGLPVWPTISRKHAKLAIAACRNMPKKYQPLCRRFAWQQGITYLLENFCLKKWEIRPEHDTESVWFFERNVRRFKPFELESWDIPGLSSEDENDFYGFNICADIPMERCRKTIRLEDHATVSLNCQEVPGFVQLSSTDDEGCSDEETEHASSIYYDVEDIAPSSLKLLPSCAADEDSSEMVFQISEEESNEETDESSEGISAPATSQKASVVSSNRPGPLPQKLSYEKQEFIARSCCKQFLQQMMLRKKGETFRTAGRTAVQVTSLLSELYSEHRNAYELMLADIQEIPTPDQREIPFSDDAEWVASRILAINRAQNRLFIPSFPPWAVMQRMWKAYGPLQQAASVVGGDFGKFVNECVSVACNHYYRLKNGIKVADEIPGDLLDLCYAITSERMREHTESVEALKRKPDRKLRKTKKWVSLKTRQHQPSIPSQRAANAELLSRCHRVYDEKRQTKRRRWNAMRYLHNALPGCVIEGIDVFDMAQRTNLSVAGIFGPEHKLGLTEMPFASDMDNRPAYLDMEELLDLMDHTLALQSGTTVDQEGKAQPCVDFLTVRGLHFKAVTGERGRCHLMVSPSAIPVPPVTVDRYGNMTSIQRAAVPTMLYPEFISRRTRNDPDGCFPRPFESPVQDDNQFVLPSAENCPECSHTSEDYVDMDFARTCFKGLPSELQEELIESEVDTSKTTYYAPRKPSKIMTEEELIKLF
ncbi:hypothetical protein RB195_001360 [Necator americanus]|uniref:Trypsin n=1 Tax=Necator americanus TaxID=51031 RepID=A0ABR1DDZ4_NECAM